MSSPLCISICDFRPPGNITVWGIYSKPVRSASLPEGKRIGNHLGELLLRPEVTLADLHPVRELDQWKRGMISWFPSGPSLVSFLSYTGSALWKSAVRELSLKSCRPWGHTQNFPGTCRKWIILGVRGKDWSFFHDKTESSFVISRDPSYSWAGDSSSWRAGPFPGAQEWCQGEHVWRIPGGEGSFLSSPLRILGIIAGAKILYKQLVSRLCKTCIIKY